MATKAKTKVSRKPQPETDGDPGFTENQNKARPLTDKQRLFVEYYMGVSNWNATDAARRAGYSDPVQSGYENKTKQDVSDEISRRIAAVAMGADEVLIRLAAIGRGSLEPFVVDAGEDVWPDLTTEKAKENFGLLKKIKPKRRTGGNPGHEWTETEVELEIHDPMRALELLGRHHKLFTDKIEHGGNNGAPLVIQVIRDKKPTQSE